MLRPPQALEITPADSRSWWPGGSGSDEALLFETVREKLRCIKVRRRGRLLLLSGHLPSSAACSGVLSLLSVLVTGALYDVAHPAGEMNLRVRLSKTKNTAATQDGVAPGEAEVAAEVTEVLSTMGLLKNLSSFFGVILGGEHRFFCDRALLFCSNHAVALKCGR